MRRHPVWGQELLESLDNHSIAPEPVLQHHERYDGGGYPYGPRGDEIAPSARITKVTDVYHAITSRRAYHTALNAYSALSVMHNQMTDHFDPEVLTVFIRMLGDTELPQRTNRPIAAREERKAA